jgi:hypothetical protein
VNSAGQSPNKTSTALGGHAPFYSQLGSFPQAVRAPSSQHGNPYTNYQHPQSMHRLDMGSVGLALPGSSPSSGSMRGFPQQAPSHTDGAHAQTSGMNFGPQLYGPQAYASNMSMQMPVMRTQAHSPAMAPHYYYNGYSGPSSHMQQQGQPMTGYPTMPYNNRSEFNNQSNHSQSYLSTFILLDRSLDERGLYMSARSSSNENAKRSFTDSEMYRPS